MQWRRKIIRYVKNIRYLVLRCWCDFSLRPHLYFEFGGAELTAESRQQILAIVAEIRQRAAPVVGVTGHTDTAGSAKVNSELALMRAKKVLSLLVSAGVDRELAEVTSHGENNLLVPTEDGVDEPRNRRVEVVVR